MLALAEEAIATGVSLPSLVDRRATREMLDYDQVYSGASSWRLLVPIDHPEPARCLVSGTGLTHYGSASSRDKMHAATIQAEPGEALTDSMRMFRAGVEGGRPEAAPLRCSTGVVL